MHRKIGDLSPTELENLSFDLIQKLGMKNLVWRTPGRDGGRDLQGEFFVEDMSGFTSRQCWYIDCKRYTNSVSWPTVWEKVSFAESNSADILLVITTSSLSPQAVDEVNRWNEKNNRLSIRFWNSVDLETRLKLYPEILVKYGLSANPDERKGLVVLPLTRILLKFSNSAYSCQVFGSGREDRKLNVVYSISELIANRLNDFDVDHKISTYDFKSSSDSFDWLNGEDAVEQCKLDKYGFRALASYIYDFSGKESLFFINDNERLCVEMDKEIPSHIQDDLINISLLSSIRVYFKGNKIEFERSDIE
ncbi:restriction endonuclease [Vibrio fluvialis]|uniref:restriction endonuclease n=1 Tax=Vibrio fluvialis TaxID=676 RepID=UPI00192A9343|nr:restriction endonuclease [Vibrio fluvialis]MBL4280784.1 restriction endonuclease [Vibrio fluvialis]